MNLDPDMYFAEVSRSSAGHKSDISRCIQTLMGASHTV